MNQYLKDKTYRIPPDVLRGISVAKASTSNGSGLKRANFLLKNGVITYQAMKRLKNYFDYHDPQTDDKNEYALAGGELMKSFIQTTLNQDRAGIKRTVDTKREAMPIMNEAEKKKKEKPVKNACAIIVDKDNKILLLKRADIGEMWMPNKWALVGGGVEKGETPLQAVEREIKEETGLEIKKFISSFNLQLNSTNSIEYMFVCRFEGDPTEVNLNQENIRYGWFSTGEMDYLDTVPHLLEYITIAFKSYE